MSDRFDILDEDAREKLRKTSMPKWTNPMLATLTDESFDDEHWIYERKLDGERAIVFRDGRGVRLMSRNEEDLSDTYPELVQQLERRIDVDLIADGEIVAFEGDVTSFSRLQQRMKITDPEEARASSVAVYDYLFDVLYLEDRDVTKVPLRDRKRLLKGAVDWGGHVRYTAHRNEEGMAYYEEACRKGWEGIIAKDARSEYVHSRSRKWLKFKCVNRQELVIGGFTDPEGDRHGFGAIVVGYYKDGELFCAGKVGTGFDDQTLTDLGAMMTSLERKTSPFDRGEEPSGDVNWITPKLVCEVGFTEWTDDGKLRHPRFLGLRRDKDPENVVRESPS